MLIRVTPLQCRTPSTQLIHIDRLGAFVCAALCAEVPPLALTSSKSCKSNWTHNVPVSTVYNFPPPQTKVDYAQS
jgi:hypothetical protein